MPDRARGAQRKPTKSTERQPRRGPETAQLCTGEEVIARSEASAGGPEARHVALLADPRLQGGPGDGQRARLLGYLQRTHGNAHVSRVLARVPSPSGRMPSLAVQRQGGACPAPVKEPTSVPPDQDPKFKAVESKIKAQGKDLKKHPSAKSKADEAQAAAVPPANDVDSQAKAASAEEMGTAKPGTFDKKAFIDAVRKAIAAASPQTLDDADKFASSGKAGEVKNQVMDKVAKGKDDSAKDVKEKSSEPPDPSRATPKPVTPMAEPKPGGPPADPGAAKAMPAPAPEDQTNLGAPKCETETKMAEAEVTEEHLKKSNEPDMQAAVEAKKAGEEHSAQAPAQVRSEEQQQLQSAQQGATSETRSSLTAMHGTRTSTLGQVGGAQSAAKAEDEAKRATVSTDIERIYTSTKTEVDGILNGLDAKVSEAFNAGESEARRAFEDNHKTEMAKWKKERYEGPLGGAQWLADLVLPLGPEPDRIYKRARDLYLEKMEVVISNVADVVGAELTKAKNRIDKGRNEITKYVAGLSPDLRAVGAEAQQAITSRFDELDQDVNNKQDTLANNLAQQYVEARNAVDKRIKEMQDENKSLWEKAGEAIGGAIEAILKLKDLFMSTLARAAGAFTKILSDPLGFIGNFMNAVKTGFMTFATNILDHLKKGLMGWLFGALAEAGIELPDSFDLKGILKLIASILGLTWGAIKARLVRLIPWLGPVIDFVESKIEVVAAFVTGGLAAVWDWIKEKLGDLKEMILTPIKEFVVEKIVKAGITWVIGMLNPAGALIKVVQALIGVVQWIMERGASLGQLIRTVVDAVSDIAHGGAGGVPAKIEGALGNAVPIVISFLANLLGLGGISEKIKSILEAVRGPVGRAIDTVVGGAIKAAKGLFSRLRSRRGKPEERTLEPAAALREIVKELKRPTQAKEPAAAIAETNALASDLRSRYQPRLRTGTITIVVLDNAAPEVERDRHIATRVSINPEQTADRAVGESGDASALIATAENELSRLERKLASAVAGSGKKPTREELDSVRGMFAEAANAEAGRGVSKNEFNRWLAQKGYADRLGDLELGKARLQEAEQVGGGAEHTTGITTSKRGEHQEGRRKKRRQEERAKKRRMQGV